MVHQTQWAPRAGGIAGCAVAGAILATCAVAGVTDLPGRVLAAIAALGLLVFAGGSWRARPKLAITPDGLLVRGWWRDQILPRDAVRLIRITEFRRIGRRMRLLEIESQDDRLLILSRWDLGVNPVNVLDSLTAAGFGSGHPDR
ncbi:MAG TPA: PH domain-containing protein [Mycobacterium sp.]